MKITSELTPSYVAIARDYITNQLSEITSLYNAATDGTVIVLAPVVPGTRYPDLEPAWCEQYLYKSNETAWWQTLDDYSGVKAYDVMTTYDAVTHTQVSKPGLSAWVGVITYELASMFWGDFDLASMTFTGRPLIVHRTSLSVGVGDATPILVDFTP